MKPISQVTYNNILSLLDKGLSLRQIATQLDVGQTTVFKVGNEARPNILKSPGGRPTKLSAIDKRQLAQLATLGMNNTAGKLAQELKNATKVDISASRPQRDWNEGYNQEKKAETST